MVLLVNQVSNKLFPLSWHLRCEHCIGLHGLKKYVFIMLSISFLIISNTPFVFLITAGFEVIVSEKLCAMIPKSVF